MGTCVNIFYKIFQIMEHYENILDNQTYNGNKYAPNEASDKFMNTDAFFSSIFKNVSLAKPVNINGDHNGKENPDDSKENPDDSKENPDDSKEKTDDGKEKTDDGKENPDDIKLPSEIEPTTEHGKIIKKYIKKCYKTIVLKCHPDKVKNETAFDKTQMFIRCKDYYDNQLLIGLLYVFYMYKLTPPAPLITSIASSLDDDYNVLMDQIIHEIRVIQDKLVECNSQIQPESAPGPEPGPEPAPGPEPEQAPAPE